MGVQPWPHPFPELLPILSPIALTSLLISYPVSILLEFKPGNQSIACRRLVGLLFLDHRESHLLVCQVQLQEPLSAFLMGLVTAAEVGRRVGHHGWDSNSVLERCMLPVSACPSSQGRLGFLVPLLGQVASRRGAVPRCRRAAWAPCTGLHGGRASGAGQHRSRHGSQPGGPRGGRWIRVPHPCPRGPTPLISCEREREKAGEKSSSLLTSSQ